MLLSQQATSNKQQATSKASTARKLNLVQKKLSKTAKLKRFFVKLWSPEKLSKKRRNLRRAGLVLGAAAAAIAATGATLFAGRMIWTRKPLSPKFDSSKTFIELEAAKENTICVSKDIHRQKSLEYFAIGHTSGPVCSVLGIMKTCYGITPESNNGPKPINWSTDYAVQKVQLADVYFDANQNHFVICATDTTCHQSHLDPLVTWLEANAKDCPNLIFAGHGEHGKVAAQIALEYKQKHGQEDKPNQVKIFMVQTTFDPANTEDKKLTDRIKEKPSQKTEINGDNVTNLYPKPYFSNGNEYSCGAGISIQYYRISEGGWSQGCRWITGIPANTLEIKRAFWWASQRSDPDYGKGHCELAEPINRKDWGKAGLLGR